MRLIKALIGYGYAISDLAPMGAADLRRILEERRSVVASGMTPDAIARRYLDAIDAMDVEGAEKLLMRASITLGPQRFIHGVMVPVLESVGQLWQEGALCVAQEHAASALVRSHVGALLSSLSGRGSSARTAVATTPAGELHELGAMMAAVVAATHGWRSVYLGPNLPATEIANAARLSGAELVLLSFVFPSEVDTEGELLRLSAELPATTQVLLGGRAAPSLGKLPPRVIRVHSLAELEGRLSG